MSNIYALILFYHELDVLAQSVYVCFTTVGLFVDKCQF